MWSMLPSTASSVAPQSREGGTVAPGHEKEGFPFSSGLPPETSLDLHASFAKGLGSDPAQGSGPDPSARVVAQHLPPRPSTRQLELAGIAGDAPNNQGAYHDGASLVNPAANTNRLWDVLADGGQQGQRRQGRLSHPNPSTSSYREEMQAETLRRQRRRSLDSFDWTSGEAGPKQDSQERTLNRVVLVAAANNNLSVLCAAQNSGVPVLDLVEDWNPDGDAGVTLKRTPLMVAAESASIAVVQHLLKQGADPNQRMSDGTTALDCAAKARLENSGDIVQVIGLLLQFGARGNFQSQRNPTQSQPPAECLPTHAQVHESALGSSQLAAAQGGALEAATAKVSELDNDHFHTDQFRMYEFKVRRCSKTHMHDWTDCPFTHPGEKARRRDPLRFHYMGNACPDFRKGTCRRGDACEFAHGVFECWLHPSRYRTQLCKDGEQCNRRVCFFAHRLKDLRAPTRADGQPLSPGSTPVVLSPRAAQHEAKSAGYATQPLHRNGSYDAVDGGNSGRMQTAGGGGRYQQLSFVGSKHEGSSNTDILASLIRQAREVGAVDDHQLAQHLANLHLSKQLSAGSDDRPPPPPPHPVGQASNAAHDRTQRHTAPSTLPSDKADSGEEGLFSRRSGMPTSHMQQQPGPPQPHVTMGAAYSALRGAGSLMPAVTPTYEAPAYMQHTPSTVQQYMQLRLQQPKDKRSTTGHPHQLSMSWSALRQHQQPQSQSPSHMQQQQNPMRQQQQAQQQQQQQPSSSSGHGAAAAGSAQFAHQGWIEQVMADGNIVDSSNLTQVTYPVYEPKYLSGHLMNASVPVNAQWSSYMMESVQPSMHCPPPPPEYLQTYPLPAMLHEDEYEYEAPPISTSAAVGVEPQWLHTSV